MWSILCHIYSIKKKGIVLWHCCTFAYIPGNVCACVRVSLCLLMCNDTWKISKRFVGSEIIIKKKMLYTPQRSAHRKDHSILQPSSSSSLFYILTPCAPHTLCLAHRGKCRQNRIEYSHAALMKNMSFKLCIQSQYIRTHTPSPEWTTQSMYINAST